MKTINLSSLITLGQNLQWLSEVTRSSTATYIKGPFPNNGIGLVEVLMNESDTIKYYNFSKRTVIEMESFAKVISEKSYKQIDFLDKDDLNYLKEMLPIWTDRVGNEFPNIPAVMLDKEYSLNPEKLLKGAENFFAPEIWKKMSKLAKSDLQESVSCLLFKLPTPAGIMALRATEAELRKYYERKTKKKIPSVMNWGTIIKSLKATHSNDTLIDHLNYLRDNLRNKLNHPDATLEQEKAENIFAMIVITITEMQKK